MRSVFFTLFFVCIHTCIAQNIQTISGVVLEKGSDIKLFGATVRLDGTRKGTTSNFDGEFTVNFNKETGKSYALRISYIGYKTQIVPITDQTFYTIYLEEEYNSLDEVILTSSYGTKKLKQEVVGSISTVKPEAIIKEQPAVSFEELLEGQVAGLNVEINPELGEAVAIDIRGQGSLTPLNSNVVGTSTQPLIIIDGIIMTEETGIDGSNFFDVGTGNLSENLLNPLAKIGIEDIETINVLKDAAAVGLYGADAANGVILITTKRGKAGDLRFNFSAQAGISNAFNGFKYLNGEQYQEVVNQYNINSGFPDNVQEWNGVNTDWFDLLNQNGSFQRYNVGITGGTRNFAYRANIGYQKNNESQIANDYSKWNASIALDYQYEKWNVSLRVSPSFIEKNNPNTLYNFALPPTLAPFDEDGNFTPFASFGNPLAVAAQNRANAETFGLLTSLKVDYDITENLKASTLFGMDFSDKDEDRYFNGLNGSGQFNDGNLGRRVIRERNTQRWNWNATLLYDKTFNEKHNFDAIGGIELRSENVELSFNRGDGFVNFETPQPISSAIEQDFREDSSETNGVSFYSQANYNFDKRYFVLVNFRVDQSSAFGGDNDTAYNAGLGGGWNISNESFFEDVKGIDFLRLRTSFGTTGNSRIGSYRALGLYTTLDNGYNANPYANLTSLPNPNLGWERNEKFNMGLDINFLEKFRFTTDYFQDVIKDMIVSRNVIPEVGLNSVQINGAEMKNWGIEMSLQANWIQNENFRWNTTINYTRIRNEVTNLTGLGSQFSSAEVARAQRIGFATSTIWGFDFAGIDPATGTELYNVGGEIYDAAHVADNFDATDWQPIGNSQPDFYGGIINNFSYKGFNLSVAMSYTYGADILLGRELLDNYNVLTNRNISVNIFDDAWQQQGDIANYQAITRDRRIISNSTKYVFDTSHIRLKAVNLSYNLPVEKMNIPLKNLSVFVNGSNLWYWFKNPSEDGKNGVAEYRNTYPEMRTFSMGLNATF